MRRDYTGEDRGGGKLCHTEETADSKVRSKGGWNGGSMRGLVCLGRWVLGGMQWQMRRRAESGSPNTVRLSAVLGAFNIHPKLLGKWRRLKQGNTMNGACILERTPWLLRRKTGRRHLVQKECNRPGCCSIPEDRVSSDGVWEVEMGAETLDLNISSHYRHSSYYNYTIWC